MLSPVCPECGKRISAADLSCHACGFSLLCDEQPPSELDGLADLLSGPPPCDARMADDDEYLDLETYLAQFAYEIA